MIKLRMKNTRIIFLFFFFFLFLFSAKIKALPVGTLLYKTGENGKMYGLNEFSWSPFLSNQHLGGVSIYLGKIDNEPSIAEVSYGRVMINPARFFIDLDKGEEFVGVKIPRRLSLNEIKNLRNQIKYQKNETEDYALKDQKGPLSGQWTSVGLAEKIYESLNNPILAYHPKPTGFNRIYYTINITPDGYDNLGAINDSGDCFSQTKEFSKIHRFGQGGFWERFAFKEAMDFFESLLKKDLKILGNLNFFGKEKGSDLYIFFPYTQYLQPTLKEVKVDIPIASYHKKSLAGMLPESQIKKETFQAIITRVLGDLGLKVVKQAIFKKLHFNKIVNLINDIKRKLALAESGLQFLGVKTDLKNQAAIIPQTITEKIMEKSKFIAGSLADIKDTKEGIEAGLKEGEEIAERTGKDLFPNQGQSEENFLDFDLEKNEGEAKETEKTEKAEETEKIVKTKKEPLNKDQTSLKKSETEKKKEKAVKEKIGAPALSALFINSGDLVINEIFSFPGEEQTEWIEIYNKKDEKIELNDFTIEDNTGPEFGSGRAANLKGLSIEPKGFLVLTRGQNFNFNLNNKGDVLILKYIQKIIDKVAYGNFDDGQILNNAPAPLEGEAVARLFDGKDTDNDLKDFALTSLPTPGQSNKIVMPERLKNLNNPLSSGASTSTQSTQSTTTQSTTPTTQSSPTTIYNYNVFPTPSSPSYSAYNFLDVVINEIAWMGTTAEAVDEWLELYNNTNQTINLNGFVLESQDGGLKINLGGSLPAQSFWLLERTDDQTISDLQADQIYQGSLGNSGEDLELRDGNGNLIDMVSCSSGWLAGSAEKKASMERINTSISGNLATNWQTNNEQTINGHDKNNYPILGTPKMANSQPSGGEEQIFFQTNILTTGIYNLYNWFDKIEGMAQVSTSSTDLMAGVEVALKSKSLNKYWVDASNWSEQPIFHSASIEKKENFSYDWLFNVSSTLPEDFYLAEAFSFSDSKQQETTSTSEFSLDKNPPATPQNLNVVYNKEEDKLIFSWSAVDDFSGIDHYEINWWEDEVLSTATSAATSFVIIGLKKVVYAFQVRAYDQSGLSSDWSEKISFEDNMADWQKRKKVTINNSQNANNLINFEINVEIPYQLEMNNDFSDLRFTDNNGQTLLNFGWEINDDGTEMKENGVTATAVVKIPYISAYGLKEIYLYYGNPSAPSTADLSKTATWFDHFNNANTAANYDYAYWNWDTANSRLSLNTQGVEAYLIPKDLLIKDFVLRISTWVNSTYDSDWAKSQIVWRYQDENNWFGFRKYGTYSPYDIAHHLMKIKDGVKSSYKTYDSLETAGQWIIKKAIVYNTEQTFEHSQWGSYSFTESELNQTGKIKIMRHNQYTNQDFIDYLYIRKNTKPMPAVSIQE